MGSSLINILMTIQCMVALQATKCVPVYQMKMVMDSLIKARIHVKATLVVHSFATSMEKQLLPVSFPGEVDVQEREDQVYMETFSHTTTGSLISLLTIENYHIY